MPALFKIAKYRVYFWSNEDQPLEPVHVHVGVGIPVSNATKLWITSAGEVSISNNDSMIPESDLLGISDVIAVNSEDIVDIWRERFGEVSYIR